VLASTMLLVLTGTTSWFWYDHASGPTLSEKDILVTLVDEGHAASLPPDPALAAPAPVPDTPATAHQVDTRANALTTANAPAFDKAAAAQASQVESASSASAQAFTAMPALPPLAAAGETIVAVTRTTATSPQEAQEVQEVQAQETTPVSAPEHMSVSAAGSAPVPTVGSTENIPPASRLPGLSHAAPPAPAKAVAGPATAGKQAPKLASRNTKKRHVPLDAGLRRPGQWQGQGKAQGKGQRQGQHRVATRTSLSRTAPSSSKPVATGQRSSGAPRSLSAAAPVHAKTSGKNTNLNAAVVGHVNNGKQVASKPRAPAVSFVPGAGRDVLRKKYSAPSSGLFQRCAQFGGAQAKACRIHMCKTQGENSAACK
jgi:hypothetical protein